MSKDLSDIVEEQDSDVDYTLGSEIDDEAEEQDNSIKQISVDKMEIDPENVRDRAFHTGRDSDEQLMESIEKQDRVNTPLTVRPNDDLESEYGIVCGSRRYEASLRVGMGEVPCIVRDVDDLTAAGLSVSENRDRDDVPTYKEAFTAIEHYHELTFDKSTRRVEHIAEKFGCSQSAIWNYLSIDKLPEIVQDLLHHPSSWSDATMVMMKDNSPLGKSSYRSLSVQKAAAIGSKFDGSERSEEEVFQFAARSITTDHEKVRETAELFAEYDTVPIGQAYVLEREQIVGGDEEDQEESEDTSNSGELNDRLAEEAVDRNKNVEEVKEDLIREGLDKTEDDSDEENEYTSSSNDGSELSPVEPEDSDTEAIQEVLTVASDSHGDLHGQLRALSTRSQWLSNNSTRMADEDLSYCPHCHFPVDVTSIDDELNTWKKKSRTSKKSRHLWNLRQMTEVVNQKHTNDYDVDIGRSNNGNSHMNNTPVGEPGWIGNPYTLKKYGGNYTRQESIDAFREAFHDRLEEDSEFREAVDELQGRVLGCYCKPDPCHGDVIVEYLDTESILDYV